MLPRHVLNARRRSSLSSITTTTTTISARPPLVIMSAADVKEESMDIKEENMDVAMGDEEEKPNADALPADANETIYVKNLNEGVKIDGG